MPYEFTVYYMQCAAGMQARSLLRILNYIVHLPVMYYDEDIHIIYMFLNHICDFI